MYTARSLDLMSVRVSFALFYTVPDNLSWDVPGVVLAAPASPPLPSLSLSLSLSL